MDKFRLEKEVVLDTNVKKNSKKLQTMIWDIFLSWLPFAATAADYSIQSTTKRNFQVLLKFKVFVKKI